MTDCLIDKYNLLLEENSKLKAELKKYNTPSNWTRCYDYKGDLSPHYALFFPRLNTNQRIDNERCRIDYII